MRKTKIQLYLSFLLVYVISLAIIIGSYLLLTTNYVGKMLGEKFLDMVDRIAVEFNLQNNNDYQLFENVIDKNYSEGDEPDVLYEKIKDEDFKFDYINEYKIGYVIKDTYYLEGNAYSLDSDYISRSNYDAGYYNAKISIISFNYLLNGLYEDDTVYMTYQKNGIILYFNSHDYCDILLKNISDIKESRYLVINKDAKIVLDENNNKPNQKFYELYEVKQDFNYKFSTVTEDLRSNTANFGVFTRQGEKTYLIYSPVLGLYTAEDEPLYLAYFLDYNEANQNDNYITANRSLTLILIMICVLLFVLFNAGYTVTILVYDKREHDFSLSKINYLRMRVHTIITKKNGKIIRFNKAFQKELDDPKSIKDIRDFRLYEEELPIEKVVEQQKPFTAVFLSPEKYDTYIHFLPVLVGNKYYLLGENSTDYVLESIKNQKFAQYNAVTNLPNRVLFDKSCNDLLSTDLHGIYNAVAAIDILDFAKINKLFGFDAANNLLREMAKAIKEECNSLKYELFNIRTSLFVIIFRDLESFNQVLNWSKTMYDRLAQPLVIKDGYLTSVEPRIGLLNIDQDAEECTSFSKVYDSVMIALDRAKGSKITHVSVYSSEFAQMLSRDQMMEDDLRKGLLNNEFNMYFQPQFNTKTRRIEGFEALIRWDNPKYQNENVEHFIRLAEKNGLIVQIGDIIINQTFAFAKEIEDTGIHISMNVSPVQLLQAGFVNDIINRFEKVGLKRGAIAIEITETFMMENSSSMISKLKLLRDHGFHIHLDDFGMGYSSLLYLKDLPVNAIKIDKDFTKFMTNDKFSRVIIAKIVQIANNLELDIIAEGVENEKQSDMLAKMGAYVIQGFLISKPVNKAETLELIKKYNGKTKVKAEAKKEYTDEEVFKDETIDFGDDDSTEKGDKK